ncbi:MULTISPECIES: NUDIX hydrolase [unclassified Moraxella]|uniref:NUDIX hydrolase n=1 Tax=unclassified Moraxella TaxID=2685852 RepID=UPI003AF78306
MTKSKFQSPLLTQLAERIATLPFDPSPQPYAVLVAITDEAEPRMLYSLRASEMREHAGEVSFAGGRREDTDDSNQATALRETFEETGIHPSQVQILGELPIHHAKSGRPVKPIIGLIPPNVTLVPEVGEIARLFWADLATLIEQPTVDYAYDLGEQVMISPSFLVDGETVWGLTGRITASLLEIGFDRKTAWYFKVEDKP